MLLNAVRINASDPCPPPPRKILLPTLGHLSQTIRGSRSGRWLCKIDLQNCYWSIRLPRSWHRVFVVEANNTRYKYTRLPFGWKHSPAFCQNLVKRIVASALSQLQEKVGHKVYLDDILLDSGRRRTPIQGRRKVVQNFKQAGFIINVKSELRPTKRLGFVGKLLNTLRKTITNQPAVLARAFRMWLRGVGVGTGTMSGSDLLRLMGRIQWLARPGTLSSFLSGAYQAAYSGTGRFTRGLIRATGTAPMFALFPQSYRRTPAASGVTYFADAAPPCSTCPFFTVGIVGPKGCYRSRRCPR